MSEWIFATLLFLENNITKSLLVIKMPNLLHFYLTDRICKLCKFPNFAEMLSRLLSDKYRRSRLDNWKNSLGNDCKVKSLRLKSKCLNFCKYPIWGGTALILLFATREEKRSVKLDWISRKSLFFRQIDFSSKEYESYQYLATSNLTTS